MAGAVESFLQTGRLHSPHRSCQLCIFLTFSKYETGAQEKLSILPKNTQQPMESQNWVTAVTDSEAPHLPRALGTNVNTGTCTLQTFKDVNMHSHVQSHELVRVSGVHCHLRVSSTSGRASVYCTVQSTLVQDHHLKPRMSGSKCKTAVM